MSQQVDQHTKRLTNVEESNTKLLLMIQALLPAPAPASADPAPPSAPVPSAHVLTAVPPVTTEPQSVSDPAPESAEPPVCVSEVIPPAPTAVDALSTETLVLEPSLSTVSVSIAQGGLSTNYLTSRMLEGISLLRSCQARNSSGTMDASVDELISHLQPSSDQLIHRESVLTVLKGHIRASLNVMCFDISLFALGCALPGDTLRLTAIIPPVQMPCWHDRLIQQLHLISTENHVFQGISAMPDASNGAKVICTLDTVQAEITANHRLELPLLAFIDEIDCKINKNHLFKRTIVLLRAWWQQEASAYAGVPVKHFLSDYSLIVMLIAVFNVCHMHIYTPLQGFFLFLQEYAAYAGGHAVITIQGIVPLVHHQPQLLPIEAHHLITLEIQEKYWFLFNVRENPISMDGWSAAPSAPDALLLINSMHRALGGFDKHNYNILHPFTHANMIMGKISGRKVGLLTNVFQSAYHALLHVLMDNATTTVTSFFPTICASTQRSDWSASSSAVLQSRTDILWEAVHCANFILEAIVTEEAIQAVCVDLLLTHGHLPVGEVGKMLAENTAVPQLPQRLKERFGGLKKFLEKYPETFIIANDHPFNPHLLLRKALSGEDLELVDRGIFPMHLFTKHIVSVSIHPFARF